VLGDTLLKTSRVFVADSPEAHEAAIAEAVKWTRAAAEKGRSRSQEVLGLLYARGEGVRRNDAAAAFWLRKAAAQNYDLGLRYRDGRGVDKNERAAAAWFRKAAEQGLAKAQSALGIMYFNGRGVWKDEREAVVWFRRAAEQGYAGAQYYLGVAYANGRGVEKNECEAADWFQSQQIKATPPHKTISEKCMRTAAVW
jgi:TPR repeat protein